VRRASLHWPRQPFRTGVPSAPSAARLVRAITPALIDAVVDYIEAAPLPPGFGEISFQPRGGAAGRVSPEAPAFWNRHASYDMGIFALWKVPGDGAERNTAWTRAAWEKLEPFAAGTTSISASRYRRRMRVASRPPTAATISGWWRSRSATIPRTSSASTPTLNRPEPRRTRSR